MRNSQQVLVVTLTEEQALLQAVARARAAGVRILDVYTPYPIHGLSAALGMGPSRLPLVAFLAGLTGAVFILWFQYWTSATDWPINVGGKPFDSLPAFVPATFEMMVLFAGYGSALALFAVSGLAFGRAPRRAFPGSTDGRFVLLLEEGSAMATCAHLTALLEDLHPTIEEQIWDTGVSR